MKGLLLFLGLAIAGASAAFQPGLRIKFNLGFGIGSDFFFEVPRRLAAAVIQRWVLTQRPGNPPLPSLVMYCSNDLVVCGLYDDNGIISGLQIGIPQDEFTDAVYDWESQGFVEWVTNTPAGDVRVFWAIQQYFVNQEYLDLDAAERLAHYDNTKLLQQNTLWVNGFNGAIDEISARSSDIENSDFTRQACVPWMGRHFYYKMTKQTQCAAGTMYPWFPLVHSGQLVGTGLMMFGKLPIKANQRDWFERPPGLAVRFIVPEGPDCLYQLAGDPGVVTMHIYYIDTPQNMGCLLN
ncbi:uncharacterized protein LOC123662177 [Melitaea cinxia]|uniref:uncharacterized protein LOC123662177 n=1 Tax=Melitaea cinxia TaxID=113334 RepID=UPI001E27466B|nr:uncharacterized protein LOC123662177 [Melitaea cinxia]